MTLFLASALVLALVGLTVGAWLAGPPLWQALRRRRIAGRPFPAAWRAVLQQQWPYWRQLPADLQLQLKRQIQVFLADKPFIGCGGLEVTDAMRVLVAAQAGLLLLNRRTRGYPNLRQVLLYPGAFVVDRVRSAGDGVVSEGRQALAGESWQQGQVILSWADVQAGAAVPDDGRNVVIHEFAHQLDQETGVANGAPFLGRRERYARWAAVLGAAHAKLQRRAAAGEPTLIDPYGAGDAAEFFAVASETFFERAAELAAEEPALYRELAGYYRVDPLSW